ncbi:hypothetical protein RUMGNA_03509 [Mediterraneibacter gnavus ATCC 29149]|uniref:Uncharacterized protein n=1 Tax=Mediterraneibacter gnavus (strain ATCC 29149 / DSM 114966 / JCM 6515 / VPI C7-9) TaxID=411470 RepID=A7B7E3_MEDG7|nr:hypothetical protein RUMGNA_03509 [Mediterraneibacter gnavus ATCC 29149]
MMEQKEHKIQIVVLSLLDIAGIMISFLIQKLTKFLIIFS